MKGFIAKLLIAGVITACLLQISCSQKQSHEIKAGLAQVNITPPVGGRLAGHFYESLSTGIHDSLWAKSMVLQQGNEKFVFVFCDLVGLTPAITVDARSLASAQTGIPVENILIAATHSHTGPLFYGFQYSYFHGKAVKAEGMDPYEKIDYSEYLIAQIVKAIEQANSNLKPTGINVGVAEQEGLSFNRRYHMKNGEVLFNPGPLNPEIVKPAGPIDPAVGILLFHDLQSETYTGGLTVFGMHADCTGGTEISADYPYYLGQTLKEKFGKDFVSAFAVGACGDVNHININKDEPIYSSSTPGRVGSTLGETVVSNLPKLQAVKEPAFAMLSTKVALPLQVPSQAQVDSAKTLINNLYEVQSSGEYVKRAGGESGDFLKRVEMSKYIGLEGRGATAEAEVQVFRIDSETAIVGLPGELFAELGLAIKSRSPFKNTIVMTVCNDKISYIPTKKAFAEGSYEVTNAIVKPGAGEMLVDTSLELLNKIKTLKK